MYYMLYICQTADAFSYKLKVKPEHEFKQLQDNVMSIEIKKRHNYNYKNL